jgi:hypothetical protein
MLPSWVSSANVRLDWKVIARYKHSSLFGLGRVVLCLLSFMLSVILLSVAVPRKIS